MNGNRYRLRSTAKAVATECIRRHCRLVTGENQCRSVLVNHFESPFSLFASEGAIAFVGASARHLSCDDMPQPHSKTPEGATVVSQKPIDFTKLDINLLPTIMIVGRPNVGKSALFNRLIRRREALVFSTPDDHVMSLETYDIREGLVKLGDLQFKVLDSAGLETEASSGSILSGTAAMTANVYIGE